MAAEQEYEHNSFVLYKDSRIFIKRLSTEQRGVLLLAIFDYVCDGIAPDFSEDGMLQMSFEMIKSYLDRDEKKYREKCKKRAEAGRKGGLAKASNANQRLANLADNDTDTDTDTVSDIDTDSDTDNETDTDIKTPVLNSVDVGAASAAANAEPHPVDLFSVKQLSAIVKKHKINLTEEGIEIFHDEMKEAGWIMYNKPVSKKGIVKALRGWTKFHPEYEPESEYEEYEEEYEETEGIINKQTGKKDMLIESIFDKANPYIPKEKLDCEWWKEIDQYCDKELFSQEEIEVIQQDLGLFL